LKAGGVQAIAGREIIWQRHRINQPLKVGSMPTPVRISRDVV
jgi:hypothetical protein